MVRGHWLEVLGAGNRAPGGGGSKIPSLPFRALGRETMNLYFYIATHAVPKVPSRHVGRSTYFLRGSAELKLGKGEPQDSWHAGPFPEPGVVPVWEVLLTQ